MRYARLILLVLVLGATSGCHLWGGTGWGRSQQRNSAETRDTKTSASSRAEEDDAYAGMTRPAKFRPAENSGTGFSNTARDIERNLGYER